MPSTHAPHDPQIEHGWGWLQPTQPAAVQPISPTLADGEDIPGGSEWQWINFDAEPPAPEIESPNRLRHWWVGFALTAVLSTAGAGIWVGSHAGEPGTATVQPTATAAPPTSAAAAIGYACTGLSGTTVTDNAGDTASLTGVIAAFEHAYYVQRDAAAALALVAPTAGLTLEGLAAGIASIPPGTTHCVAITPLADSLAEVHLAERHLDGSRMDYLQLINAGAGEHGTVIINIQKRG
ncbi:hypothetical protein [Nocardia brasiliensis]|uniref:hypothetical protein n=1 Tax=Nocardia brasiliensis TaxID=37326 RepID=UPI00245411CE|nr:hypothetical protein [Nocardia brasiliensis]